MPNHSQIDNKKWGEKKYFFCRLLNSTDIDSENVMKEVEEVSINACTFKPIVYNTCRLLEKEWT